MTRRRSLSLGLGALVAIAGLVGIGAGSATAAEPDPVLLVHGYRGSPSTWSDMIARFAAQGRTAIAIDLSSEDNVVNARAIRDFISARGWRRADIVAQSMGGLSARQFVKFLKSPTTVDSYVSLGTPQYGITTACILPSWYGGQMCPSSAFLRDLNRRDDTPGKTAWTTIYSTSDEFVPNASSRLDGGACHSTADGKADTVNVNGTKGDDSIAADANGNAVDVSGLAAFVRITHADPDNDTLVIDPVTGVDQVAIEPAVQALIQVSVL